MTLLQLKLELLELDPYVVVKSGLDGFSPYSYIDHDFDTSYLSESEDGEWDEYKDQYLTNLIDMGSTETREQMKRELDIQCDSVIRILEVIE